MLMSKMSKKILWMNVLSKMSKKILWMQCWWKMQMENDLKEKYVLVVIQKEDAKDECSE